MSYFCAQSVDTYISSIDGGNWKLYIKETCQTAKENGETRGEKYYNKLHRHLHIAKQELGIVITSEG